MIEELIKELAERSCFDEFKSSDWFQYSTLYHSLETTTRLQMAKVIAAHTGVSLVKINDALQQLEPDLALDETPEPGMTSN